MADSINYQLAKFVASYGKVSQIPESTCPEVSFVGRVGHIPSTTSRTQ